MWLFPACSSRSSSHHRHISFIHLSDRFIFPVLRNSEVSLCQCLYKITMSLDLIFKLSDSGGASVHTLFLPDEGLLIPSERHVKSGWVIGESFWSLWLLCSVNRWLVESFLSWLRFTDFLLLEWFHSIFIKPQTELQNNSLICVNTETRLKCWSLNN